MTAPRDVAATALGGNATRMHAGGRALALASDPRAAAG